MKEIESPEPKGSQVLIRVQSAGVCHSDIHLWDGGYEASQGQFLSATERGVKISVNSRTRNSRICRRFGRGGLYYISREEPVHSIYENADFSPKAIKDSIREGELKTTTEILEHMEKNE